MPTLGYPLPAAQLTTVGKACLWIQDLWMDLQDVEYQQKTKGS